MRNKNHNFRFSKFTDGLLIDNDINKFISLFFPFSVILEKSNLICISLDSPFVIELTHHLEINFVTHNKKIFKKINNFCKDNNIDYFIYDANSDFMKEVRRTENEYA